jgi:hypothetical protein
VIIWLNGTYGAGKTTTANELTELLPESTIFDAEQVGYMLRHVKGLPAQGNFQHWRPWRGLVVDTATRLLDHLGGTLVIPQTVLVPVYWLEIRSGLAAAGIPIHHFVLHTDPETLTRRIEADTLENRQWRLDHRAAYEDALPWLRREAELVDTTTLPPRAVAERILTRVRGE